ncbi:MAG: permease, partial [bacterium]|nr:permease [bacterium]
MMLVRLFVGAAPAALPRLDELSLNAEVLGWTVLLSLVTAALFGILPALRTSRSSLARSLVPGGPRLREALIVGELALSLLLLIGAGLLVRSFVLLRAVDPGFRVEQALSMDLQLPSSRYENKARQVQFYDQLIERVSSLPGVESAAAATNVPLHGSRMNFDFEIKDRPPLPPGERVYAQYHAITPGYFRAMGIPLRQGRFFEERDNTHTQPVVVINEAMANRFFGAGTTIGRRLGVAYENMAPREIVGVVGNVKHFGLDLPTAPEIYVPFSQNPWTFATIVVRTSAPAAALAAAIRNEIRGLDSSLPAGPLRPTEDL